MVSLGNIMESREDQSPTAIWQFFSNSLDILGIKSPSRQISRSLQKTAERLLCTKARFGMGVLSSSAEYYLQMLAVLRLLAKYPNIRDDKTLGMAVLKVVLWWICKEKIKWVIREAWKLVWAPWKLVKIFPNLLMWFVKLARYTRTALWVLWLRRKYGNWLFILPQQQYAATATKTYEQTQDDHLLNQITSSFLEQTPVQDLKATIRKISTSMRAGRAFGEVLQRHICFSTKDDWRNYPILRFSQFVIADMLAFSPTFWTGVSAKSNFGYAINADDDIIQASSKVLQEFTNLLVEFAGEISHLPDELPDYAALVALTTNKKIVAKINSFSVSDNEPILVCNHH